MEELFGSLVQGAGILFNPDTFLLTVLYMIGGLLLGMFVGALPGLTTLTAMAILLPIVFFLPPIFGIPFLLGIYKGGIYGAAYRRSLSQCRAPVPPSPRPSTDRR